MIDYLKFGGTEHHLYDLVTNIDRTRFETRVICFHEGNISRKLEADGFELIRIPLEKINSYKAFAYIPKIVKYIKKNEIQIMHTLHVNADIYGTLVGKLASVPVIISSRRDMGFTRPRKYITFQNLFIDRFVTSIVANSIAVRDAVHLRERIPYHKIDLIYNGIKVEDLHKSEKARHYVRSKLRIQPDDVVVGTLATFNPVKRYDLILRAAKDLQKSGKIHNIKFLLVGGGKKRHNFEQLSRSEGLYPRVVFTGHRQDISRVLSAMDIFVNFSDSEGFSNSILQAMAMSLPVIASNVGGNPEVVEHGVNGYLVPPGEYHELSRSILNLAVASNLREKMGKENRKKVTASYQTAQMINQFEELYCKLLAQTRENQDI